VTRYGPHCGRTWKPWTARQRRVNPFSTAYTQAEIAAYGAPLACTVGDVELRWLDGCADRNTEDYLNWPMIARWMLDLLSEQVTFLERGSSQRGDARAAAKSRSPGAGALTASRRTLDLLGRPCPGRPRARKRR